MKLNETLLSKMWIKSGNHSWEKFTSSSSLKSSLSSNCIGQAVFGQAVFDYFLFCIVFHPVIYGMLLADRFEVKDK